MTIYSYLQAGETLEKPALISNRERKLIGQSAIARQSKSYTFTIPESHWRLPKPIPPYVLKVIDSITFKFKMNADVGKLFKKCKMTDKLLELILSLPSHFDDKKVNLDMQTPGKMTRQLIKFD